MIYINKNNDNEFKQIYNIMCKSFPDCEFRSFDGQKKLLCYDYYNIAITKDSKNNIAGLIAHFTVDDFIYIDHFAMLPELRGKGIGRKFLNDFIFASKKDIVLEVEPPQDTLTEKRIAFYSSMGFNLNDYEYYQPPLRKDTDKVPLMLMTTKHNLSDSHLDNIKNILYKDIYKYYG